MTQNWCFLCELKFNLSSNDPQKCPNCNQQAYEEITEESHPEQFTVYRLPPQTSHQNQQQPQHQHQQHQPQQQQINMGMISNLGMPGINLMSIFGNQNQTQGQSRRNGPTMESQVFQINLPTSNQIPQIINNSFQIMNFFLQNLTNSGQEYRRATESEVNSLQLIPNPKECSICQTENTEESGYKLKCGHEFHKECIKPWFDRANTCPTCRETL